MYAVPITVAVLDNGAARPVAEEVPVQILHEGEDYDIREQGNKLYLQWRPGFHPDYEIRHRAIRAASITNGDDDAFRFAERDKWYHARLRILRDLAELMQEDARVRAAEEREKTAAGLANILFLLPTISVHFSLSERDLAGGTFAQPIVAQNIRSFSLRQHMVRVEMLTDVLGVIQFDLWPELTTDATDSAHASNHLALRFDSTRCPDKSSLVYLAMRQIAHDLLARREDTAFVDATIKRVWREFYAPPPPVGVVGPTQKRAREEGEGEGEEEGEPEQKRARVDPDE
jgi:hypothetical protein